MKDVKPSKVWAFFFPEWSYGVTYDESDEQEKILGRWAGALWIG